MKRLYKKIKIWSDSKADVTEMVKKMVPNAKPCPCCGKLVDTPFCPICGFKMDEAEIVGKRVLDGFIDGMGDNIKSVGQKFINNDKDTVEHTIMGMKNEVKDV